MTSKELAAILDVSPATISLVINGKPGISDKTRSRIIAELQSLGYGDLIKPTGQVPTLSPPRRTIGFILYRDAGKMYGLNSFYPLILDSVERTARTFQYNLVVINIEQREIERQIQYISEANCVGFVIFAPEMQEKDLFIFEKLNIPFVILDNYFVDKNVNSVKINNEQACYLTVKHLTSLGHSRIGYLSSGLPFQTFIERREYSKKYLLHYGISQFEKNTFEIGYPIDQAIIGMKKVLENYKKEELPTAFLADNDLVAIGAMDAAKEMGYILPDDFSFIGNADRPISSLIEPKLTTTRIPHDRFGTEAVFQLIQQLENPNIKSYTKVEINCELVVRGSVKDLSARNTASV